MYFTMFHYQEMCLSNTVQAFSQLSTHVQKQFIEDIATDKEI